MFNSIVKKLKHVSIMALLDKQYKSVAQAGKRLVEDMIASEFSHYINNSKCPQSKFPFYCGSSIRVATWSAQWV